MTVRDMLAHRTGITRHDLIWYKSDFTQKDLFERLKYLEPSESPRSVFLYNNMMYAGTGYSIELLSGKTWESLRPRSHSRAARHDEHDFHDRRHAQDAGARRAIHGAAGQHRALSDPLLQRRDRRRPRRGDELEHRGHVEVAHRAHERWPARRQAGVADSGNQADARAARSRFPNTGLEVRGWGEILNATYGMGRWTASYRGHLIAYHGGDLPGFHSQVSTMPYERSA